MSAAALAFALAAAAAHASWNVLLARARDPDASGAVALLAAVVLFAPLAIATGGVSGAAAPYIAASAALELAYFALLAAAYRGGELSVVYPVARGSAPVLVLAVSAGVLGAATSAWQVAGVGLVAAGVLLVRGIRRPDDPLVVALALSCGACIAGYTIVDAHGLDHAAALPYLWVVLALTAAGYLPLIARVRGTAALRAAVRWETVAAAVLFFAAYLLVLAALRRAEPGPVAAVRETSVVIATALGALVLREPVTRARAAGAVVVVAGIAAIALS